jgi:hypothetical protein
MAAPGEDPVVLAVSKDKIGCGLIRGSINETCNWSLDDDVDRFAFQHRKHLGAGRGRGHVVSVLTKEGGQQGKNILVIIDEQEVWHWQHSQENTFPFPVDVPAPPFVSSRTHCKGKT